jgi:hypothetical protein
MTIGIMDVLPAMGLMVFFALAVLGFIVWHSKKKR